MKTQKLLRRLRKGDIIRASDLEWSNPNPTVAQHQIIIDASILASTNAGLVCIGKGKKDESYGNYFFRKVVAK